MARFGQLTVVAVAIVRGGVSPTFIKNRGFISTITRISPGGYNLTLPDPGGVDSAECIETLSVRGVAASGNNGICINHLTDTQKQIFITVGGVAADADFSIKLEQSLV